MRHPLTATLEYDVAARFAPADRPIAEAMLARYGEGQNERQVDEVRRALLELSGGRLSHLGHYLALAQHDHRSVLYWAAHPDQAPLR
jgi:hypothetical protein